MEFLMALLISFGVIAVTLVRWQLGVEHPRWAQLVHWDV